ncbi:MAG: response regulator [Lachnospiraceae bacterium]|nr:response regulator [Lachnospiraceae bacterium]
MGIRDYEKILDAMQMTGVYVIREDNHQILYFNNQIRTFMPDIGEGLVCHEIWGGSCKNCPLLTIGDRQQSCTINYEGPFGKAVDIAASRIRWEDRIPAFVVTVTPHMESASYTYHRILRANLDSDRYVMVKSDPEEPEEEEGGRGCLSEWLGQFLRSGKVYVNDRDRFADFVRIENLRQSLHGGKRSLTCTYRRQTRRGFRWTIMEVVPDFDYASNHRSVMICSKDVHDLYREGLEREDIHVRHQEIIRSLGEQNYGIYLIDLKSGLVNPVRVDGTPQEMEEIVTARLQWDEYMAGSIAEQLHEDYRNEFFEKFSLDALRRAREEKTELFCQRRKEDGGGYISVTAYVRSRQAGREYAVLALQDVDERIRREIEHSRHDMQLAAIIKSRYSMMSTVDLTSGYCERVYLGREGSSERTVSGDYESHVRQAMASYVCEEDVETFRSALSLEYLRSRAADVDEFLEEVCQYRIFDGQRRWVEAHVLYIRQRDNTVLVNILGRDITGEKDREEKGRKASQEKTDVIGSLSSMFFATYYIDLTRDEYRRVTQLDSESGVLEGVKNYSEALKLYAGKYVHPDDQEEYIKIMGLPNLLHSLGKEQPCVALEYRRRLLADTEKRQEDAGESPMPEYGWARATAVLATQKDGQAQTVVYAVQDVTETKRKEEREQRALREACEAANHASASKSEFLSRMSHDIRTPMNGILGMTAIAEAYLEDKNRVKDCLNKIRISSRHLLSLINEVLDMSKIESGKMELAEDDFAIPDLMHNLETMIGPAAREKNHTLIFQPVKVHKEQVRGDMMRLQQVFVNILGNSVKYTPPGGVLKVSVLERESTERGYGCYEFVFEDNGIGMDEDFVKQIFEPFSRAEDSRVSKIEGTGLGMTIAQNIVRMMDGRINVESRPGAGSRFIVTVFLKQREAGGAKAGPEPEGDEPEPFTELGLGGCRVLIVEDNEINREIAQEIIESAGAAVESVTNGREAVERFARVEEGYYDLIFMDIQMPVLDGYKATREIRNLPRRDAATVPVIAMSANAFTEDILAGREAGMDEYITKPLEIRQLLKCLKRWLKEDRPQ